MSSLKLIDPNQRLLGKGLTMKFKIEKCSFINTYKRQSAFKSCHTPCNSYIIWKTKSGIWLKQMTSYPICSSRAELHIEDFPNKQPIYTDRYWLLNRHTMIFWRYQHIHSKISYYRQAKCNIWCFLAKQYWEKRF